MPSLKISFCLVPLLVLALTGWAEAACDNNVRVQPEDSQCLIAWHSNSHYRTQNKCTHKIRVKLDIKNGSDSTFDMNAYSGSGQYPKVEGSIDTSWWRSLRDVTCCSDWSSCNH